MKRLPYIVLAIVVAVAFAVVIINITEFKPVTKPYPPIRAAQKDRFLALDRSLQPRPGTIRFKDINDFDPNKCQVLICDISQLANFFPKATDLAFWVASGGRLVLECNTSSEYEEDRGDSSAEDPDSPTESGETSESTDTGESSETAEAPTPPTKLLPDHPLFQDLEPDFKYYDELFDSEEAVLVTQAKIIPGRTEPWSFKAQYSAHFPQAVDNADTIVYRAKGKKLAVIRHWGKGLVFLSSWAYALENNGLKLAQDRVLANYLFSPGYNAAGSVWIPLPPDETIPTKSVDSAAIWWSVLLVCLMLFWMTAPRLGPTIPETIPQRRSLRERFIAEGRFLWKHKVASRLIDPANSDKTYTKEAFTAAVDQIVQSTKPGAKIHHDH